MLEVRRKNPSVINSRKQVTLVLRCQLSKNEFNLTPDLMNYFGLKSRSFYSLDFLNDILSRSSIKSLEYLLKHPENEKGEKTEFNGRNPITDLGIQFHVKVKFFDRCHSQNPDNVILTILPEEIKTPEKLPFENRPDKAMIVLDNEFKVVNGNHQFLKALRYYNMNIHVKGKQFGEFVDSKSLGDWKSFKAKAVSGSIKLLHKIDSKMLKCIRWYVHFGNNHTYIVAE